MADESISHLMELWKSRQCSSLDLMGRKTSFHQILGTFSAQRVDSRLFHFRMKQQAIGPIAVSKCLQWRNLGSSQRDTITG